MMFIHVRGVGCRTAHGTVVEKVFRVHRELPAPVCCRNHPDYTARRTPRRAPSGRTHRERELHRWIGKKPQIREPVPLTAEERGAFWRIVLEPEPCRHCGADIQITERRLPAVWWHVATGASECGPGHHIAVAQPW